MRLREPEDGHSVYILYSDLLFNLVIVFLITVLALVLRMNNMIRQVTRAPAPEQPDKDVVIKRLSSDLALSRQTVVWQNARLQAAEEAATAAAEKAESARNEAKKQVDAALAAANGKLDAQMKELGTRLSIAAGANRFTGRTGGTSLCVGIDLSGIQPKYVLINSSDFSSAHSTLDGESDELHRLRSARLLTAATRGQRRYIADELNPLFKALSVKPVSDNRSEQGQLRFSFSVRAMAAASGWLDRDGDVDTSRALKDIERHALGSVDETQSTLINVLLQKRDTLSAQQAPGSVPIIHFSDSSDQKHVSLSGTEIDVQNFRGMIAAFGDGGVILQYDASGNGLTPQWIIRDVLTPVGYVNSVPDTAELQKLGATMGVPKK